MASLETSRPQILADSHATGRTRATSATFPRSLITDEPWDAYHLESLLAVKEVYRETTEFGFLLRHYWIPATVLTYRQSALVTSPDGNTERQELRIERRMARCRSNECTWREIVTPVAVAAGNGQVVEVSPLSELICSYDCYDQTYVEAKPVVFELPTNEHKEEARRQALYCMPILIPPGPVPIGFAWHARVGDDYMNFRLEAEEHIGDTSVLIIRREGRYTTWLSGEPMSTSSGQTRTRVVTKRQGVTVFARDRAVVLEDRYLDQVVEVQCDAAVIEGTVNQAPMRLIRSVPLEWEKRIPDLKQLF